MKSLNIFRPDMHFNKGRTPSFTSLRARLVLLISYMLCILILTTSCTLPWETQMTTVSPDTSVILTDETTLDKQSLVQELAACISDTSQIEYVYNSIPASQIDGISYAVFSAYITALTHLHTDAGAITSFRFLTEKEGHTITQAIADNASQYQSLLGATIPVELFYNNEQSDDAPVYIYIQEDVNGTAYLSNTWVKECLTIFDFAGLYFEALEMQNTKAVASLINESQIPALGEFSSTVINYKARELVSYYHLKVQSPFTDYRLLSLDISQLTYLQPEVLDDISLSLQSRTVHFIRNALSNISIRDSVTIPLSTKEFYLYFEGARTIRIGDRADSNQFLHLFGKPVSTVFTAQFGPGTTADQQFVMISYGSTTVTINGSMYVDGSWDGQIVQIDLHEADSSFVLGSSMYIGMTRDTLMMLYPFADQTDYLLTTTLDDLTYGMSFTFADNKERTITGISLALID